MEYVNSKELKPIKKALKKQYGLKEKLPYTFFSSKNDIYAVNDSIRKIHLDSLRVNTIGIYIGEMKKEFRPSIEGSQIIGKMAKKNVFKVDKKLARMWMYGLDIPCKENLEGWVIIKSGNDFLGSGRLKQGKILNHVPKGRRIHE